MTEAAKEYVDLTGDARVEDLCIALSGRKVNEDVKATVSGKLPYIIARLVTERINATASLFFDEDLLNAHQELLKTTHRNWNLYSRPMEPPPPDVPPYTEDPAGKSEPIVRIPKSIPTPPMALWKGRPTRPRTISVTPRSGNTFRTTKIAGQEFADWSRLAS